MKMKTNPILEERWQTKDALAREAGDDVARICENTRRRAAAHPHSGPVVKDAAEFRAWLAWHEELRQYAPATGLTAGRWRPAWRRRRGGI